MRLSTVAAIAFVVVVFASGAAVAALAADRRFAAAALGITAVAAFAFECVTACFAR